jgi:hypothetical protein
LIQLPTNRRTTDTAPLRHNRTFPSERQHKEFPEISTYSPWRGPALSTFQAEIKKAFKADIPLKQRNEWESYLREEGARMRRLTAQIEEAEREIDAIVYKLFDLTPDEIALLESSLAGQY